MLNGQPLRTNQPVDDDERARIHARLESLNRQPSGDTTRRIGSHSGTDSPAYDGSLARTASPAPAQASGLETRAFLVTAEGGVLAELPCSADAGPVVIGRGREADVSIEDPYVHRHQAEISWDAEHGAHVIAHGGGENGTYVNRHRVRLPLRLVGGEQVRVGKTMMVYRVRR